MKTQHVIILVILLVAVSVYGKSLIGNERAKEEIINNCKQIRLGMHKDDVIESMGKPNKIIRREEKYLIMVFSAKKAASTFPQVYIDPNSNVVIEVVCDDSYRLIVSNNQS